LKDFNVEFNKLTYTLQNQENEEGSARRHCSRMFKMWARYCLKQNVTSIEMINYKYLYKAEKLTVLK